MAQRGILEAERADRISRLAGLAPVSGPGSARDQYTKTKSTVGSASATGSAGRTANWLDAESGEGTEMDMEIDSRDGGSVTDQGEMMSRDGEYGSGDESVSVAGRSVGTGASGEGQHRRQGNLSTGSAGRPESSGGEHLISTPEGDGLGKFYFEERR
jgi:hypothetical protein